MTESRKVTGEAAERMREALLEHARELFGNEAAESGRWQTRMSQHLGEGVVAQQTLSKFMTKKGPISVGMARDILQRLGEDPDDILGGPAPHRGTDMSPARARVLHRVASFFPADVVEEVRRLSTDSRSEWTEIDWLDELMSIHRRHLARAADIGPKSSQRPFRVR